MDMTQICIDRQACEQSCWRAGKLFREPLSVVSEPRRASAKMDGVDSTDLIIRAAIEENNQKWPWCCLFPDAESERRYNTCAHGLSQALSHALGWSALANEGLKQILNNAEKQHIKLGAHNAHRSSLLSYEYGSQ